MNRTKRRVKTCAMLPTALHGALVGLAKAHRVTLSAQLRTLLAKALRDELLNDGPASEGR